MTDKLTIAIVVCLTLALIGTYAVMMWNGPQPDVPTFEGDEP